MPDADQLRLFLALFEERNLTRAARKVGLSQPATSRALIRLRETFHDPLFVRTRTGMQPTPRSEMLAPSVRRVLDDCAKLVEPEALDPAKLKRTFTLAMHDFGEVGLLPALVAKLTKAAPGVDLVSRPEPRDIAASFATGRLDLAIGLYDRVPADLMRQHLFDDHFVSAIRQNHPSGARRMSLQTYARLSHVLIAPSGEPGGIVDQVLRERGLTRRVQVRLSSFVSAPLLIAQSDLVVTGPSLIIEPLAKLLPLHVFEPPIAIPHFAIQALWPARLQADPAHAFLRRIVAEIGQGVRKRKPSKHAQ